MTRCPTPTFRTSSTSGYRRRLRKASPTLFKSTTQRQGLTRCVDRPCTSRARQRKDAAFYERECGRRCRERSPHAAASGIGIIVFAHKSTAGWEAILQSVVDAGWVITGSWPVDTEHGQPEMRTRTRARSLHPFISSAVPARPTALTRRRLARRAAELPRRIHEWMPRLAEEGVVGADAIFACLGPALEVFSRYSRVEKASGEPVTLQRISGACLGRRGQGGAVADLPRGRHQRSGAGRPPDGHVALDTLDEPGEQAGRRTTDR